jgi:hypothetical protein
MSIAPAEIPATLTVDNLLDETLIVAGVRFAPLEKGKVIPMAKRSPGNKCDLYLAFFSAENSGHVNARGLRPLANAIPSGHSLAGGQDPVRTVTTDRCWAGSRLPSTTN